jgi:hypothetical protein
MKIRDMKDASKTVGLSMLPQLSTVILTMPSLHQQTMPNPI